MKANAKYKSLKLLVNIKQVQTEIIKKKCFGNITVNFPTYLSFPHYCFN